MNFLTRLDKALVFAVFGLTFGGVCGALLLVGEVVVLPTADRTAWLCTAPVAASVFAVTAFAVWALERAAARLGGAGAADQRDTAAVAQAAPSQQAPADLIFGAAPSLVLLALLSAFCATSRLSEPAVAAVTAACGFASLLMQRRAGPLQLFAAAAAACLTSTLLLVLARLAASDAWDVSARALGGLLPLWTPSLMFALATTWGQVGSHILDA
jgi:hypothetical protein